MISFRYHVVSLVACLFALAVGIALGAGVFVDDGDDRSDDPTQTIVADDVATVDEAYQDTFVDSVQGGLIARRLQDRAVGLVLMPGADPATVESLSAAVTAAGGTVTGTVELSADLVDPGSKQLVDSLGGQLESDAADLTLPAGTSGYDRFGRLLGYAVGTTQPAGAPIDDLGRDLLAGMSTAGLVSVTDDLQRRADLLLVVAPAPPVDEDAARGTAAIMASLTPALDESTGGVVIAGPAAAGAGTGVLAGVRRDAGAGALVSTVDSVERPAGVVVTVLALQEQVAEGAGHYGGGEAVTGVRPGVATAGE